MIIKIFSSSSIDRSVKGLFAKVSENWFDSFIDSNGIWLPFIDSPKKEAQDTAIKDFNDWWKVCGSIRADAHKTCYSIIIYFHPNDRSLNQIEQTELIKDWLQGMNINPDSVFYIAYSGDEATPKPIHIVLSRVNIERRPLIKLYKWKNVYLTRELEKKYNLETLELCL